MLKYLSKFVLEILPSVVATIIGAYIVNHYIAPKPAADAPVAASVSTAAPKGADTKSADAKPADVKPADVKPAEIKAAKADAKAAETPSDVANVPDPGAIRKIPLDKASADTASLPTESRRHQPLARDKATAKAPPTAGQAPTVAAVSPVPTVPPVEASPAQDRDANDIARAAIERLRNSGEASRTPEPARVVPAPPLQPLPPPIMVSTPPADTLSPNGSMLKLPSVPLARGDDPRRPTPPADIPLDPRSRPLDLHAEAGAPTPERTTVAEDMLSAAKSVFHSVLPR
jgi:hypothetical protein